MSEEDDESFEENSLMMDDSSQSGNAGLKRESEGLPSQVCCEEIMLSFVVEGMKSFNSKTRKALAKVRRCDYIRNIFLRCRLSHCICLKSLQKRN